MAISWHLTPKRGIFTAFVQKTWQFHGQKNFLAMKILGHFLKKRSSNWKKHGNFMAFKKKIQKNRNVAELPRFESPDVAFQNFPAATLHNKAKRDHRFWSFVSHRVWPIVCVSCGIGKCAGREERFGSSPKDVAWNANGNLSMKMPRQLAALRAHGRHQQFRFIPPATFGQLDDLKPCPVRCQRPTLSLEMSKWQPMTLFHDHTHGQFDDGRIACYPVVRSNNQWS